MLDRKSALRVRDAVVSDGTRIRFVRSSANPLFESAAAGYGGRVVAVCSAEVE